LALDLWALVFSPHNSVTLVELAGEIKMLNPKIEIKMIQASRLPLNDHYPDSFRQKVLDLLKSRNIEVLLNEKADLDAITGTGRVNLRSGKTLTADVVVLPKLILCSLN